MRRDCVLALATLLMVAGCRPGATGGTAADRQDPQVPAVAFEPLTRDDIGLILRTCPVLDSLRWQHWYSVPTIKVLDNMAVRWTKQIDSLQTIEGLDSALADLGADWPRFRAAAYRTMVTINAIGYADAEQAINEQLRYSRHGARTQLRARRDELKRITSRVPKGNVAVFTPHERELLDVFYSLMVE